MKFLKKLKLLSFITMFILFGNVYAALPSNGTYTFINATNNGNGTYTTSDGFFLISTSSAKGVGADQYGAFVRYFDANLYQIEATSGGTDYIEVSVIGGGSFKLTGGVFGEFDQFAELTYNNFTNVYVAGYANGVEVVRTTSHNSPTYETNYNLDFSTPNFSNYVIDKVRVYFTYTTSERPAQLNLESLNISTASTNPPPSANTAPTITGAVASQAVNDTATLSPFSNVTLADTENNNLSITITLDNNAKGVLSGMGLSGTGPYTLSSDTPANVQTKLRALVFNPTDNRVAPASTETTTFTITANDGTDDSTPNNTTTVISTSINDAPTITSTPITTINEDSNYSYTLGATDVDGDGLTWSVKSGTSLPSWLSLNSSSNVTTFAGSGTIGATDATGTAASFYRPFGVAVDSSGNIYVADYYNHKIRKVTSSGVVSTLAGSGTSGSTDATGTAASFNYPTDVAVDSSGNIYVADKNNNKIRKITPAGVVTTLAGSADNSSGSVDGTGTAASFNFPSGLALDSSGNIYVADYSNNKIRKVTPAGVVTTLAGSTDNSSGSADGTGSAAKFNGPSGVALDSSGNIYVADLKNQKIRKITPAGVVTTLAGSADNSSGSVDGTGTAASFNYPTGVAVDSSGNIYVGDFNNHKIRKITPDGVVTTLAGSGTAGGVDGTSSEASFSYPAGVALDSSGNVYVADYGNHKIRKITPPQTTLSGTPTNADAGDYNITLVVSDGVNETEHNFTITVNNVNDAPSDINISSNSIAENSVSGTTIGTLSVTDVDSGDSATFSFCGGVDDGNFIITGITLKSNSVFDYETKSSYSICVRVTDSGSATFDKNITISITDVNENSGGGSTPTPVNGVCGSSNGSPLLLANITNQCNSGTASSITDAGTTYIWSCSGTNGGATANCSVTKPIGTITNHIASTGASGLTGTTFTTESDKEVMTATVTNNDNENITIKVELPTDSNSEIKTKHSVTISTKKTEAISKLEATVDIKSDKSVETKASKDTTDIVVTAKPDGTAEHTVTLSGNVVSKATSNIIGANTVIDENGTVETMAGDVNTTQNGVTYTIKAVAETKADGKTITKFVKVNNNTNDVELIGNTVLPTTPFEAGTNVIIDNIDGTLYIKTSAPLDENLVIE